MKHKSPCILLLMLIIAMLTSCKTKESVVNQDILKLNLYNSGKLLYTNNPCGLCHGVNGNSSTGAPSLRVQISRDSIIKNIIGITDVDSLKISEFKIHISSKFSTQDIADLMAYIRADFQSNDDWYTSTNDVQKILDKYRATLNRVKENNLKKIIKANEEFKLNPDGARVYNRACRACHSAGVAGAPKFGNNKDWQKRIKKGKATLYKNSINGIGGMPAKGGQKNLTDEMIRLAVDYILEKSIKK